MIETKRTVLTLAAGLAITAAALPTAALGQVTVAPTMLVISGDSRFGTFLVNNQSASRQEVTVSFRFGHPVTDAFGQSRMQYGDTLPAAASASIVDWVRAFPRQFVLGEGEQQIIRLTVRPPADLPDGVYWARIVTTSAPQAAQVDTVEEGLAAQIIFRLEQVTTILYRQGNPTAAVEVGDIRIGRTVLAEIADSILAERTAGADGGTDGGDADEGEADDDEGADGEGADGEGADGETADREPDALPPLPDPDTTLVHVLIPVRITGDAPFFGSIVLRVLAPDGSEVLTDERGLSIYFDGVYSFSIDPDQLPEGEYTAEVTLHTNRSDIPPEDRFPIEPITTTVPFSVSG